MVAAEQALNDAVVRRSAGAMLLAESRTLVALRREVRAVSGELVMTLGAIGRISRVGDAATARVWALSNVGTSAKEINRRVGRVVLEGRRDARAMARRRLRIEVTDATGIVVDPQATDAAEDAGLADVAASSYAAAWGAAVMREVLAWADNPSGVPHIQIAASAQDYRLARIAGTEIPRAYNDEHAELAASLSQLEPLRGRLLKRWESMLDRRVCKTCAALDGKIVSVDASWPRQLEPGDVHPLCRCFETVLGADDPVVQPLRPASAKTIGGNSGAVFIRGPGSGYVGGDGSTGGGGSTDSY